MSFKNDGSVRTKRISAGNLPSGLANPTGWACLDSFYVPAANARILLAVVRRDLSMRFNGSVLGKAWLVLLPIIMMVVYTAVFGAAMGVRFDGAIGMAGTALATWASLVVWQTCSESIIRAASVLHDNAPFVKRMPFPVAVLPLVPMFSAGINLGISSVVFLLAYVAAGFQPSATWLALPLVIVPMGLGLAGVLWLTAAVGAAVRDLKQVLPVLTTLAMFSTPVVWPMSSMPRSLSAVLALNPLAWCFETMRDALFGVSGPNPMTVAVAFAVGLAVFVGGYAVFRAAEKEMRDAV